MNNPRFKAPQLIEVPFAHPGPQDWSTQIVLTRSVRVYQAFANTNLETVTGSIFYVDVYTHKGVTRTLIGSTRLRAHTTTHATSLYTEHATLQPGDTLVFRVQGVSSGFLYVGVIPLACDPG